ncbi:MAG: hypothetical protein HC845_09120 [Akkermansiaceae bacterium]|nr:hypothetical protein [Akkermansiaceae bacterium]
MKTIHILLLVCLIQIINTSSAEAQAAPATAPKFLLSPPPGTVVWTIRYTYKDSAQQNENNNKDGASADISLADGVMGRPNKTRFIIKHPVSSSVSDIANGKKQEAYYFGNNEFTVSPRDNKVVYMVDTRSYPSPEQLFRKHFPGVNWVNRKFFVRTEVAHGEPCYYFRNGNPEKRNPNPTEEDAFSDQSKYEIREAWFSIKTGLPVAYKAGENLGKYSFEPNENIEVTIPQIIREQMAKQVQYEDYEKKRAKMAERSSSVKK